MNYGLYLRTLREFCINKKMKNEDLVNELIQPLIEYGNVKKIKMPKETLYYETTEASRIINNKLDISNNLRDALRREGIIEVAEESVESFCQDNIRENDIKLLIDEYLTMMENDTVYSKKKTSEYKELVDTPICFLAKLLLESLRENNLEKNDSQNIIWTRGNAYIKVIEGDLFQYAFGNKSKNKIVVIPVNTTFEVHITTKAEKTINPLVSLETLHGKFLLRVYKSNISEEELKKRIVANLKLNGYKNNEKNEYSLGAVASLDFGESIIYLLAISSFDQHNNAHSSVGEIGIAIEKMINYYDNKGQGYELYLPLLGTGMSRANMNNQESFDLIISTLLNNKCRISGGINIVIQKETIDTIRVEKEM